MAEDMAVSSTATGGLGYDGELASSILLDDGDGCQGMALQSTNAKPGQPLFDFNTGSSPPFGGRPLFGSMPPPTELANAGGGSGAPSSSSTRQSARHLHQHADGETPYRIPTRTPSPVYQGYHSKVGAGETQDTEASPPGKSSSSSKITGGGRSNTSGSAARSAAAANAGSSASNLTDTATAAAMAAAIAETGSATGGRSRSNSEAADAQATQLYPEMPFAHFVPPYWPGFNPQAYYGMMMNNPMVPGQQDEGKDGAAGMDPNLWQVMMAMQAAHGGAGLPGNTLSSTAVQAHAAQSIGIDTPLPGADINALVCDGEDLQACRPARVEVEGKRTKARNKEKQDFGPKPLLVDTALAAPAAPRERGPGGAKGDRRRRGGGSGPVVDTGGEERPTGNSNKSRSSDMRPGQSSNPIIEQLKARDRNVELSELAAHIAEIAQDQYGSRLIQQKLELASEEEKQLAFKSVLMKMPQLTTDVFGNYVIQKFFEYGNSEQRRILAEQLVGQVLRLSLQMYGCRVVQKALDSVPIEQQVLLVGELKGHVLKCIEDQHGNHVIQKCIERLPTDRISFIVESFQGQTSRMAKHCYGCRVIQRLIEYCRSAQISPLLEEVLRCSMELATDQYGNYVVQHVMEHSSRPGDRQTIMHIVRTNILSLSCHKYASNVIEKALACGTVDERAQLIYAIIGEQSEAHPALLTMMRDRFGNYIVQRVIALAQGPQRDALLWKLHEYMPALKKSNTYGKHIISALERAQGGSG
jgi:pumilio RNA-binding family